MKKRFISITLSMMIELLILYGSAFAHGIEKRGKSASADSQMMKLHAIMPMFSVVSAKLETALEKGDVTAVETESGYITAAIPDLKKSKPHKNIKQRKKFIELASDLEKAVISTKLRKYALHAMQSFVIDPAIIDT